MSCEYYISTHDKKPTSTFSVPEKITEEDLRLLANINKIELPIFPLEYSPLASNIVRKESEFGYFFLNFSDMVMK